MAVWDVKYIALVQVQAGTHVFVVSSGPDMELVKQHISWWPSFVKLVKIKPLEREEEVAEWNDELAKDPDHVPASTQFPDNSARVMSEPKP